MSRKTIPSEVPEVCQPSWEAVVLVCRDCRKRGSVPKDLKLKPALQEARRALKPCGLRARVVACSCLGLCPKRAFAVAVAGAAQAPMMAAVRTVEQLAPAVAALDRKSVV